MLEFGGEQWLICMRQDCPPNQLLRAGLLRAGDKCAVILDPWGVLTEAQMFYFILSTDIWELF